MVFDQDTVYSFGRKPQYYRWTTPMEYVLYASGLSARQTVVTDKKPVDAVVMAIVDSWDIEGTDRYRKGDV